MNAWHDDSSQKASDYMYVELLNVERGGLFQYASMQAVAAGHVSETILHLSCCVTSGVAQFG